MVKQFGYFILLLSLLMVEGKIWGQTPIKPMQNLAVKSTGEKYINPEQETDIESSIANFTAKTEINVVAITNYTYSQEVVDILDNLSKTRSRWIFIYENPMGGSDWDSNVKIIASEDVGKIIAPLQLENIRKKIMIPILQEQQVNYYDEIYGYKRETFSEALKYYMSIKLALTEMHHTINPPPKKLGGIEYEGKLYKDQEAFFVDRSIPTVSFKAEELYQRGLDEDKLKWSIYGVNSEYDYSAKLSDRVNNQVSIECIETQANSIVKAVYGDRTVEVNAYFVIFNASKDKAEVYPNRVNPVSFFLNNNLEENKRSDFHYEVKTEGPVDNVRSYAVESREDTIKWYSGYSDNDPQTTYYPSGSYKITLSLVGPNDMVISRAFSVKILPLYHIKNLKAVDKNSEGKRFATKGQTLYMVGSSLINRDVTLSIESTDPTKKFWPNEPRWEFKSSSGTINKRGGTSTLTCKKHDDYFCKTVAYEDSQMIKVKFISEDRYAREISPELRKLIDYGKMLERTLKKLNLGKRRSHSDGESSSNSGNRTSTEDTNPSRVNNSSAESAQTSTGNGTSTEAVEFSVDFKVEQVSEEYNKEEENSPKYNKVQEESLRLAVALSSGDIPIVGWSLPPQRPFVRVGIFLSAAIDIGIQSSMEKITPPDKTVPTDSTIKFAINTKGEIIASVKAESSIKVNEGSELIISATGLAKSGVELLLENENKQNKLIFVIQPLILAYAVDVSGKVIGYEWTLVDWHGEWEVLDRMEFPSEAF